MYKYSLYAVVVVVVLCIGCSDEGVSGGGNNGGGTENRLIVNGEQVYGWGALESNYTGSFTHFVGQYQRRVFELSDAFTKPVINMVNGKLTIDLGEPTSLMSIEDAMGEYYFEVTYTSDRTAKIFWLTSMVFVGGCSYVYCDDEGGCSFDCDSWLGLYDMSIPLRDDEDVAELIYADKPVTINGNYILCSLHPGYGECQYDGYDFSVSINLQKGWNIVSVDRSNYGKDIVFENSTGSGDLKWIHGSRNAEDHLVVPLPTTTPILLHEDIWKDGSITSSAFGSAVWYAFNVVRGETYYVWWSGVWGDDDKLRVIVSAIYSDGSSIFINESYGNSRYGHSFTSNRNGTVQVRVAPDYFGNTGTFAVAYSTSDTRPDSPELNKSGVGPDYKSDVLSRQKRLKERSNSLFKRF